VLCERWEVDQLRFRSASEWRGKLSWDTGNGKEYGTYAYAVPAEPISLQGSPAGDETGAQVVQAHVSLSGQDSSVHGGAPHSGRRSQHSEPDVAPVGKDRSGTKARTQWPGGVVPAN